MLFKPKFVFALVALGMCLVSFDAVYGKPASNTEQNVESSEKRIRRQNCPNLQYGCDQGYCWSRCQDKQLQSSSGERRSSSRSETDTLMGCTSDQQCVNHYYTYHNDQIRQLNDGNFERNFNRRIDHVNNLFRHFNQFDHSNQFDHRNLFDSLSQHFLSDFHNCPNPLYGCENGYCWSNCGSSQAQDHHESSPNRYYNSSRYSSSDSSFKTYTGCKTMQECTRKNQDERNRDGSTGFDGY